MNEKIRIGQKFEKLEVIEDLGMANKSHLWACRCSCGKIIKVRQSRLLSGEATQCASCAKTVDYKGQIIQGYKVIKNLGAINGSRYAVWQCTCIHCGKAHIISSDKLSKNRRTRIPKCSCQQPIRRKSALLKSYIEQMF